MKRSEHSPASAAISPPAVAPRLSIVVLPFANLSGDPDQQYFADGITENLTTDVSWIEDMLVISRNSAFTYKDKLINAKEMGRELGVRYVLEGSVQRSGNALRVNAQLIDAETDTHLWAERFDRTIGDLFALQNEITVRIAREVGGKLIAAEASRPTTNPDALDFIFRGRALWDRPPSSKSFTEAISFFEHALALDPRSIEAQIQLAITLIVRVGNDMSGSPSADLDRAEQLIRHGLAASPDYLSAHFAEGLLMQARGRPGEAAIEFETVLSFNPNSPNALHQLGWSKLMTGSLDEVIPLAEQAIRLSPRDPCLFVYYGRIGTVHLLLSQIRDAILWHEKARSANPQAAVLHASLAAEYALDGKTERAAAELAEAQRLSGGRRYASLNRVRAAGFIGGSPNYRGVPKVRALFEATYFAGLRKAGMPEE